MTQRESKHDDHRLRFVQARRVPPTERSRWGPIAKKAQAKRRRVRRSLYEVRALLKVKGVQLDVGLV